MTEEPLYEEQVKDQGFDPRRDARERWTLKAAKRRIDSERRKGKTDARPASRG